jgi:hypothetical protein
MKRVKVDNGKQSPFWVSEKAFTIAYKPLGFKIIESETETAQAIVSHNVDLDFDEEVIEKVEDLSSNDTKNFDLDETETPKRPAPKPKVKSKK